MAECCKCGAKLRRPLLTAEGVRFYTVRILRQIAADKARERRKVKRG